MSIDTELQISGAVTLTIADATYSGTALSGGPTRGRSSFRIVGGKGKWGKTILRKAYSNDAGVKLLTVLQDAAQSAGEQLDFASISKTDRVGSGFSRPTGPASRVLEQVAPSNWYVGEDGLTRLGSRAPSKYTGKGTRIKLADLSTGVIVLAAEDIKTLVPGVIVDGVEALDVVHEISAKTGLRTTIYGTPLSQTSRRLQAFREIFDQLDPLRKFRGIYEYRVVTLAGTTKLNLQPTLISTGMPDLERVPIRTGLAGGKSTLVPGTRVIVGFVNADPTRPEVIALEDLDGEGFKPVLTSIDAQTLVKLGAGIKPAAGLGDMAGPFPIVTTQVKVLI